MMDRNISSLTSSIYSVILSFMACMTTVADSVKNTASAFLNLIYPKTCKGCLKLLQFDSKALLCENCEKEIKINKPPFCLKCGFSLSGPENLKVICGKCIGTKSNLDRVFFCCNYDSLIKDLIHQFKYNYKPYLIDIFNVILADFIEKYVDIKPINMILPIPLHRGKLQQRGFDQSLLLAKNISKRFNINLCINNLIKKVDTLPQTKLTKPQRIKNVENVFHIKDTRSFKEKNILLIDDVVTTTATANECAYMLKQAKANHVWLLALARGI